MMISTTHKLQDRFLFQQFHCQQPRADLWLDYLLFSYRLCAGTSMSQGRIILSLGRELLQLVDTWIGSGICIWPASCARAAVLISPDSRAASCEK